MLKYFLDVQKEINDTYQSSERLKHTVIKGTEREVIISEFLRRHIPDNVEIGSGTITDQNTTNLSEIDRKSLPQLDIVLAHKFSPNLTFYGGTKIYFSESIISVLEVKSNLTTHNGEKSELNQIFKHTQKVKRFKRQIMGFYIGKGGPSKYIPYFAVSFKADVNSDEFFKRLKERHIDESDLMPDGFFNLDPENNFAYLRKSRACPIGINQNDDGYFVGGKPPSNEVLSLLWFTLINNIEDTRLLSFPADKYIEKLYSLK